jgi:hypothetical protein
MSAALVSVLDGAPPSLVVLTILGVTGLTMAPALVRAFAVVTRERSEAYCRRKQADRAGPVKRRRRRKINKVAPQHYRDS